jgi:hypothetical protein
LAAGWNPLPIRSGYLGGVLLVGAAIWAKTHWRSRAAVGDDPGGAERRAWLYVAGTALICGFVGVILMTPGSEVHRYTGDTGGHDSWIMFGGGLIAWWLLHDARAPVDERDRAIDAFSNRVGYSALVIMLLFFLFTLGFAPKPMMARFTHWLIANTLLTIIMLATLAQYLTQLIAYWRGRRGATEMRTRDVG